MHAYCHVPFAYNVVHVAAAGAEQVVPDVSGTEYHPRPLMRMSMLSFVAAGILYHMQMYG